MMLELILRNSAISSLPKLLLKGALLCTLVVLLYNIAYLHRQSSSLIFQIIAVWFVVSLYLSLGKVGHRCSQFDMALPISTRRLWLAHTLAVVLGGALVLAVAVGIVAYGIRLLYRMPHATPGSELDLFDMIPHLGAGMMLTIALLNSPDTSLSTILHNRRNAFIKLTVLAGVLGLIILLRGFSPFTAFLPLIVAFAIGFRSYCALPEAFTLVPLHPEADKEPSELILERKWDSPAEIQTINGFAHKRLLVSTIYQCLVKMRALGLIIFPFLLVWGMLLAGFFSTWKGWEEEFRFTFIIITAYVLFSGAGGQMKQIYLLDPLPISRKLIFAVSTLPYLLAICLGYAVGRIGVAVLDKPMNVISYIADSSSCCHVSVPIEFCRITWDGDPPENSSPWGESHPAWIISLFKGGRMGLYSPFDTPESSSPDFVALQISRAVDAIYGKSIQTNEIRDRYLDVAPDGSIGLKGSGLTLLEDYPDLKRRGNGPVFPVLISLAGIIWFFLLSIYLRTFRVTISNVIRKVVFFGLMVFTLFLHMAQYVLFIDGKLRMWVLIGFWKTSIRSFADALPGGAAVVWIICALVLLSAYWFAQKQFMRIEIPVEKQKEN